jgi:uncharacterized protein with HEPN domain
MSKRADTDFLCDSKEAILRINSYVEKLSYEEFLNDMKTQVLGIFNSLQGNIRKYFPE